MSPIPGRQIFQSASGSRWQHVKWSSRLLAFFALLALGVLVITLVTGYMPSVPRLREQGLQYKKALDSNKTLIYQNSLIAQKYQGFRQYITDKEAHFNNNLFFKNARVRYLQNVPAAAPLDTSLPCAIRSAFYVAWDPQSFFSLQRNISKLNLVIPEWMFINPNADTLFSNVDERAFAVMKKAGVRIMPILSNNYLEQFRGDAVHRIIHDPVKKQRLINDVLAILQKNNFAGVNVDFEDLQEKTD
jgi:hypothetical protein